MKLLGNVLWLLFGGLLAGLIWLVLGCLWCITIIGIPLGLQCFKQAKLSFCPFGKDVINDGSTGSFLLNLLWIIFTGVPMAFANAFWGLLLCVTIVGIPFGKQFFKLAKLSLMPFGTTVVSV